MKKLAILGLGHIGQYVLDTLSANPAFCVKGYDLTLGHDLADPEQLLDILRNVDGVLASTPYFLNRTIAQLCNELSVDYFDLTESVEVTNYVKTLDRARFVTQCGLAPGMVSVIANHMALDYERVQDIEIRVGALPTSANNHMGYFRTWSTEGLVNEYIHPCPALRHGELVSLEPLTHPESVTVNGTLLEAMTTSGGLGSLAQSWQGCARHVNYKTLRYPGHWNLMRFLKDDLGMKDNFQTFVDLFNRNIPLTRQDSVYIWINVTGWRGNSLCASQYARCIPHTDTVTAIQLTTAGGAMAVLDVWNQGGLDNLRGWIAQEQLSYSAVWNSEYAQCYH